MSRVVKLDGNRSVVIVSANAANSSISKNEAEMDLRAREAVKAAVHKAKTCKKPIARYDRIIQKAYIESENGTKKYV